MELAARPLFVVYNLWTRLVRFIFPQKHTEDKRGRRWLLLIAPESSNWAGKRNCKSLSAMAGPNNCARVISACTNGSEQLRRS